MGSLAQEMEGFCIGPPNKRLKLTAHVGVFDFSPARRSLSAIR